MTDPTDPSKTVALLARWSSGDPNALDELMKILYQDIHGIAVRELRRSRNLTLRPTALANEAYLRLVGLSDVRWQDRAHFLSMAARVTRQALVDEARRRSADKRSGGTPVTLSDTNIGSGEAGYDALDVDALLEELKRYDEVAADIVSLRVFGGLSIVETAEVLSLSVATVNRRWVNGKTWLARELTRDA
jgi:RNA polymerase sigma factor (TIGR02999 family)